ncbi:MAG: radical SAM protein [Nanoarchaeota archaeon]
MITILDCYTDEPSGLGVPPYLGVYPRYLFGKLHANQPSYLTIDDLRNALTERNRNPHKTDISVKNLTRSREATKDILGKTETLYVVGGVHTPGKYLSAMPASMHELARLLPLVKAEKILTGPASMGSQAEGGKKAEMPEGIFDEIVASEESFDAIARYAPLGADVLKQIPYPVLAEIETGRGCMRSRHCSFCMEGLKRLEFRDAGDIRKELEALKANGVQHMRFGKQADFYSYQHHRPAEIKKILESASGLGFSTIHIDNTDPQYIVAKHGEEITRLIVEHCTPGNVAAFGVESFDPCVQEKNCLNCTSEMVMDAARLINRIGAERGDNGMPKFLPGINLILGLPGETKETHAMNMRHLKAMVAEGLLLRRINIREAVRYPGTPLFSERFRVKTQGLYWKWKHEIRNTIDHPMLERVLPKGTVLKGVRMEVRDGNNTFGRQWGTYPLVVGVKEKLHLGTSYDVRVKGYMLRSVIGEALAPPCQ